MRERLRDQGYVELTGQWKFERKHRENKKHKEREVEEKEKV